MQARFKNERNNNTITSKKLSKYECSFSTSLENVFEIDLYVSRTYATLLAIISGKVLENHGLTNPIVKDT